MYTINEHPRAYGNIDQHQWEEAVVTFLFQISDVSRRCQPYVISSEMIDGTPVIIAYCPLQDQKSKRTPKHRYSSRYIVLQVHDSSSRRESSWNSPKHEGQTIFGPLEQHGYEISHSSAGKTRAGEKKSVSIPGREFVQPLSRHIIAS